VSVRFWPKADTSINPKGVAVGADGTIYIADFYNHRVQKFAPDGTFLTSFGTRGSGTAQFEYPIAVAIAPDGDVFVADFGNHRVQRWRHQ